MSEFTPDIAVAQNYYFVATNDPRLAPGLPYPESALAIWDHQLFQKQSMVDTDWILVGGTILFGVGVPAPLLGMVGNIYLNTVNGALYTKTGPFTWFLEFTPAGGGGGARATFTVAVDTIIPTLTQDAVYNVDTSAGPVQMTLPDAVLSNGFQVNVKKITNNGNAVTVVPPGGQQLDSGAPTAGQITGWNDSGTYGANNSNWWDY